METEEGREEGEEQVTELDQSEDEFGAFEQLDPSENPFGDIGDPNLSEGSSPLMRPDQGGWPKSFINAARLPTVSI